MQHRVRAAVTATLMLAPGCHSPTEALPRADVYVGTVVTVSIRMGSVATSHDPVGLVAVRIEPDGCVGDFLVTEGTRIRGRGEIRSLYDLTPGVEVRVESELAAASPCSTRQTALQLDLREFARPKT